MSSIRKKLHPKDNKNDSKNTRMNIATSCGIGDFRTDILAHMSRYGKIAELAIQESKRRERPIKILEIGCGEMWAMQTLYHAHVIKKSDIVSKYTGVDIDPAVQAATEKGFFKIINGELILQDVTVKPKLQIPAGSIDFFYTTEVIEHMKRKFVPKWLDGVDECLRKGALILVSTPNSDGSKEKLPVDHVYEWGFEELKNELTKRWKLDTVVGTFIQLRNFEKCNREQEYFPPDLLEMFKNRFDHFWLRNILAAPFPEKSNNCLWILRKRQI